MAELLADLLLDQDLIDAQVELLLPLAGVHWRVLDGIEPGQQPPPSQLRSTHEASWLLPTAVKFSRLP